MKDKIRNWTIRKLDKTLKRAVNVAVNNGFAFWK